MNQKKQTPVQWLRKQLATAQSAEVTEWLWTKALEMEREQKLLDHIAGQEFRNPFVYDYDEAEQYFTDTYQSEP